MNERCGGWRRSGGSRVAVAALVVACTLPACFSRAKKQHLIVEREFVLVQGRVEWEPPVTGPVLLFASAPDQPEKVYGYKVIEEPREFRLRLPRGESYSLWAVEDADRDLLCDPDERGTQPVTLELHEEITDLVVRIEADSRTPLTAVFDVQESVLGHVLELEKTFANTGTIVDLSDERFSKEWAGKGIGAPITFLIEVGAGTYMLQEYDPNRIPVLFVHGSEGSPRDFSYLIDNLDDRLQPWVFHYPSGFGLRQIASHLNDTIEELHVRHGFEEMYVVAHSMGGLVSRSFLQRNAGNAHDYITKFLTISTPWQGHSAARMGVRVAPDAVPSWHDMVPGSEFQVEILGTPLPEQLEFWLFFSYKGSSMFTGGADDGSVAVQSQLAHSVQGEATRVHGFNESHTSILTSDEVMVRVNEFLQ